jgi:hypothetical protein
MSRNNASQDLTAQHSDRMYLGDSVFIEFFASTSVVPVLTSTDMQSSVTQALGLPSALAFYSHNAVSGGGGRVMLVTCVRRRQVISLILIGAGVLLICVCICVTIGVAVVLRRRRRRRESAQDTSLKLTNKAYVESDRASENVTLCVARSVVADRSISRRLI